MNEEIKQIIKELANVRNVTSNNGNDIPNQFIIRGENWVLFQSYNSPIVLCKDGKTYIFKDWDYSNTTGKYRNQFLGETKQETYKKLKDGEYIPVDFEVC